MLAAFSGANFARIPHAARFVSSAALVRRGLLSPQLKKKRKTEIKPQKNKVLIVAAQGGKGVGEGVSYQYNIQIIKAKQNKTT